jgi:nematocidal protein AidA
MEELDLASSSADINVMVVIDTDYVKDNYPNPSQDMNHPTGIDHKSQFMICTDPRGINNGQGSADLSFKALPGDHIAFRGTSIYGNSDDAIIVYNIVHWSGDSVFNSFRHNFVKRTGAAVPDTSQPTGLPALHEPINFTYIASDVSQHGTENFYVYFALYKMAADGETQNLFGYFYWDPTITVA